VHYKTAIIAIRKSGGDVATAGVPFLEYSFGMVFTTKIEWSGPGDEGPEESITFAYGQFAVRYWVQEVTGEIKTKFDSGWDVTKNVAWTGIFCDKDGLA